MSAAGPTRRAVLTGGGVLLVAGCLPGEDPVEPSARDVELGLRAGIAAEVSALAAAYGRVLEAFPAAREQLSTLAGEHAAHVEALLGPPAARRPAARPSATPSPAAPSSSAPPTTSPPGGPSVPPSLPAARAGLADAEARAARRRARQAREARPELARLLASIAACNAAHAALLREDPA